MLLLPAVLKFVLQSGEYWYARNNGQDWTFKLGQHPTFGPANPLDNKSAMLSVSRNGGLRLIHQAANGRWGETIAFLEGGPLWVDESLTHASFSPSHSASRFPKPWNMRMGVSNTKHKILRSGPCFLPLSQYLAAYISTE